MMKPGGVMVASSPSREKLPTPGLTRLINGKAAFSGGSGSQSRSRGRSARSSPMFVSRSKSAGRSSTGKQQAAAAEEGEPSSPKVTCIGQVRMRKKRSSKKVLPKKRSQMPAVMPCRCLHKSLICNLFRVRNKPKGGAGGGNRRSKWLIWPFLSARSKGNAGGYQQPKPGEIRPPQPPKVVLRVRDTKRENDHDSEEEEQEEEENESDNEEEKRVFVSSKSTTPPKNALMLMRCRSAPHNRASALARAVSPFPLSRSTELATEQQQEKYGRGEELEKEEGEEKVEERKRSRNGSTIEGGEHATAVVLAAEEEEEKQEEQGMRSESQRPLVLTRSKSEPAGRAEEKVAVRGELLFLGQLQQWQTATVRFPHSPCGPAGPTTAHFPSLNLLPFI